MKNSLAPAIISFSDSDKSTISGVLYDRYDRSSIIESSDVPSSKITPMGKFDKSNPTSPRFSTSPDIIV